MDPGAEGGVEQIHGSFALRAVVGRVVLTEFAWIQALWKVGKLVDQHENSTEGSRLSVWRSACNTQN